MLRLLKVSVRYGLIGIIRNVSIEVPYGKTVMLIGSNGAGKTTLLKAISGGLKPFSGEIYFEGQRIDGKKPYEIVSLRHLISARRRKDISGFHGF